jgi:hypothetical protein
MAVEYFGLLAFTGFGLIAGFAGIMAYDILSSNQ